MPIMHLLLLISGVGLALFGLGSLIGVRLKKGSRPLDLTDWESEYETERRKRLEMVAIIQDIQRERDGYKDLWWACALEHSAAQNFMAAEYSRLLKFCRSKGLNPKKAKEEEMTALAGSYEVKNNPQALLESRERIESKRTAEHVEFLGADIAKDVPNA